MMKRETPSTPNTTNNNTTTPSSSSTKSSPFVERRGGGRGRGRRGGRNARGVTGRGGHQQQHHGKRMSSSGEGGTSTAVIHNNGNIDLEDEESSSRKLAMSDEDVMILFMQHLRSNDPAAKKVYQEYGSKRKVFVEQVRLYLMQLEEEKHQMKNNDMITKTTHASTTSSDPDADAKPHNQNHIINQNNLMEAHDDSNQGSNKSSDPKYPSTHNLYSNNTGSNPFIHSTNSTSTVPTNNTLFVHSKQQILPSVKQTNTVIANEYTRNTSIEMQPPISTSVSTNTGNITTTTTTYNTNTYVSNNLNYKQSSPPSQVVHHQQQQPFYVQHHSTPFTDTKQTNHEYDNLEEEENTEDFEKMVADLTVVDDDHDPQSHLHHHGTSSETAAPTSTINSTTTNKDTQNTPPPKQSSTSENVPTTTPAGTTNTTTATNNNTKWQPKRLCTRRNEQIGKIYPNNIKPPTTASSVSGGYPHLILGPRKELKAVWSLPLSYLRERMLKKLEKQKEKDEEGQVSSNMDDGSTSPKITIRDALSDLSIGLFRRGCPENGAKFSIISKLVLPSSTNDDTNGNNNNYKNNNNNNNSTYFEINEREGILWGWVQFYTPRTPGNIVLRLYFENDDDAMITLATSQCIKIVVGEEDLESTLRYVLSNFKSKKGSGTTNFSSIHSLAAILEQFTPSTSNSSNNQRNHNHNNGYFLDGAGRAAWGCICESRKIMDAARDEYLKKKSKLMKQENDLSEGENTIKHDQELLDEEGGDGRSSVNDDKEVDDDKEGTPSDDHDDMSTKDDDVSTKKNVLHSVMSERSSNDRKWREIQAAFASVLRSVVMNNSSRFLFKRDILVKLKLEYELWCHLCESFATNPFESNTSNNEDSVAKSINYPHPITKDHFDLCQKSRFEMQSEMLGFIPKYSKVTHILQKDHTQVLSNLSTAMETLYKTEYVDQSSSFLQLKAKARYLTEQTVSSCDSFPEGTKVVVFGSSANGFGSPLSDLDMCIQLPSFKTFADTEDTTGSSAMAKLAECLKQAGMVDVDISRLTARIPVVKFNCTLRDESGDEHTLECDLSMQNPLACINTSLLHSYSLITPEVRILVAVIKKWAKARDINNPSDHTLSSYGYIIMLLHFLTTHTSNGNCKLIETCISLPDEPNLKQSVCPLIPNLQWMHPRWLQCNPNVPYQELDEKPVNQFVLIHPTEQSFPVNAYFFRIANHDAVQAIQNHLNPSNSDKPTLGNLLLHFFRYYAYEFDYKRNVVSLNTTLKYGYLERECKAEEDGWKLYGQSLCIEDPFETFYDVAHVLKPSNFQRIRREFALAFTKLAGVADVTNMSGARLLDLLFEEVSGDN